MIGYAIILLAIGWAIAWAFDKKFVNKPVTQLEGEMLSRILKRSGTYETLRSGKKVRGPRPIHRDNYFSDHVDEPRDRGDGARVLQIDSRRKVR